MQISIFNSVGAEAQDILYWGFLESLGILRNPGNCSTVNEAMIIYISICMCVYIHIKL